MPTVKNGKVSLNLKVDENQYNEWVKAACKEQELNMSAFIRKAVNLYIQRGEQ